MTTERYERKLTAILSADVKGYSRLMGEDEEATILTLNANREMMADLIINGQKPEADINLFGAGRFAEGKDVAGRYEFSIVG